MQIIYTEFEDVQNWARHAMSFLDKQNAYKLIPSEHAGEMLPGFIMRAIARGHRNTRSIARYLDERRLPYSIRELETLLSKYAGRDHEQHLWHVSRRGAYYTNFKFFY